MVSLRRSARIASGTPQRATASPAPQITSVNEEMAPTTPVATTTLKLPMSEMHPSKVHPTVAEPSSGLRLGFTDIKKTPATRPMETTPSKTRVPSSDFSFRQEKPGIDTELGPAARQMMERIREDASRIKSELLAKREEDALQKELEGRRIAMARGKASRFSAVHMAEFKKMDSIENHASVLRTPGRSTPVKTSTTTTPTKSFATPLKSGVKRKAQVEEPDSVQSKKSIRSVFKSAEKPLPKEPDTAAKRVRQRVEDDATTARPVSRDASSIPRPKSSGIPRSQTHSGLSTPTKAAISQGTPSKPTISLVKPTPNKPNFGSVAKTPTKPETPGLTKSPSKPELSGLFRSASKKNFGSLKKSVTISDVSSKGAAPSQIQTPGRFDRVKSILKRSISGPKVPNDDSTAPQTPSGNDKELPPVPLTTPGRKLFERRVEFTPDTKRAAATQNSPSPSKPSIPRPKSASKFIPGKSSFKGLGGAEKKSDGQVSYPDLSAYMEGEKDSSTEEPEQDSPSRAASSVPGKFTFRADHTIDFDGPSADGFGSSAGQASLRQVRTSMATTAHMPGAFPVGSVSSERAESPSRNPISRLGFSHGLSNKKRHRAGSEEGDKGDKMEVSDEPVSDKENQKPAPNQKLVGAIAHGLSNKKRHRASEDEEEVDEGAERGAKKVRKDLPSSVVGRPASAASSKRVGSGTPSPIKKKLVGPKLYNPTSPQKKTTSGGGISLSRLNALARPKNRT